MNKNVIPNISIEDVVIHNRKITKMNFSYEKKDYGLNIDKERIILTRGDFTFDHSSKDKIAEYVHSNQKTFWYIEHCCGLHGFGRRLGDVCYACDIPESKVEATNNNSTALIFSRYSENLSYLIQNIIPVYIKEIESSIKELCYSKN